jgi:superfamily I DNA/RNA helicase
MLAASPPFLASSKGLLDPPYFPSSVLLFLAEFLEARIIPRRIEHRIELEQRGVNAEVVRKVFALLLRRERCDKLFEARIAAKSIPVLLQLQRAVGQTIR